MDSLQHITGLESTISRGISREVMIGNILDQGIVPTTAARITELSSMRNWGCIAYLLITRALTTMGTPLIAPLAIKSFCFLKYVTKLGP